MNEIFDVSLRWMNLKKMLSFQVSQAMEGQILYDSTYMSYLDQVNS